MRLRPPIRTPIDLDLRIDTRVFVFALGAALISTFIAGLLPTMQALRTDLVELLRGRSSSKKRVFGILSMREFFVVAQVTGCTVLLAVSGIFLAGFRNALSTDLGFDTDAVVVVAPPSLRFWQYSDSQARDFYTRIRDRAAHSPGVTAAALVRDIPLDITFSQWKVLSEADRRSATEPLNIGVNTVGPNYFATMGIRLIGGRDFDDRDTASTVAVAIVNSECARRLWPGQNPLGKRFVRATSKGVSSPMEVIAVVATGRYFTIGEPPRPFVFIPFDQNRTSDMRLVARAANSSKTLARVLSQEILPIDSRLPTKIEPLRDALNYAFWPARTGAVLFTIAGGLALTLAALGLYGVMGYMVSRKTPEIGLRVAVGAGVTQIVGLVVSRCAMLLVAGTLLGGSCAIVALRYIRSLIYGVSSLLELGASLTAILVVVTVGLLATLGPLRRALKVDPLTALRYE
jgi:predicted permease